MSEQQLDDVFARYREAMPDPEPGPGFTPGLWRKIDTQRSMRFRLQHLSRLFLSGAAAAWLLMAAVLYLPADRTEMRHRSYVDALAASHESGSWVYAEALHGEIGETDSR